MSKSRGNVVRPRPIVNVLGIEPLRYYLLREIVFGQDGSFSYDALVTRYNSDLANGLGKSGQPHAHDDRALLRRRNSASRRRGRARGADAPDSADFASEALDKVTQLYDRLSFSLALESIWEMVAIDRQIHHGRKTVDAGRKAGRPRAPGNRAVHGGRRPAHRRGAGASRAAAIDAENLAAIGADRAARQCSVGPACLGTAQARNQNRQAGRNFPAR